jgi:hypothetical protein
MIGRVPELCPRLLINRESAGFCDQDEPPMGFGNVGTTYLPAGGKIDRLLF